ncbi:hypothetical protein EDF58_101172 [Novosphingobium sp. PhB57]|uniref:hypothetical protein n=1 Tax=Novosphingobium sp. PhB57 TaxID=2485107 RepID=UPI00104A4D6F|nr:hypothetical protein [Novosphingobium sp. PhB57]TCU60876.1 hypothetical protein EDF58_101172 [Novosphingobium sp. PhB57]
MSLLALTAAAALTAAPATAHSVQIDHHGASYAVDYVTHVETRSKAIGISPPTRPSSRRCIVSADVSVERRIQPAGGGRAITTRLPETRTFTQNHPGDCRSDGKDAAKLVAGKSDAIGAHVRKLASADHHDTLAAIDAARDFAVN